MVGSEFFAFATRHSLFAYFTTPTSRKYFITPGWISAAFGAAATVFAAVVSQACGSFLHSAASAPCSVLRQSVGDVVGQAFARQHKTPGADGIDRRRLIRIAVGGHRQRFEEGVLGADARDLAGVGRDEPCAAGACAIAAKPGQPMPAPHSAAARPSCTMAGPSPARSR